MSYDYLPSTQGEIFAYIERQEHLGEKLIKLKLPEEPQMIKLPLELAKQLKPYAIALAAEYSKYQKVFGFRYLRQFQTLTKYIALLKGKDSADQECLNEVKQIANYINFQFNKI